LIGLPSLLLCVASLTPELHPVSNYRAKLILTEEATEFIVYFTYDDVSLNQKLIAGNDGRFAASALEAALPSYEQRLVEGTRFYDASGSPLEVISVSMSCAPLPPNGLSLNDLLQWNCSLAMRFPTIDDPDEASVLIDWGCWRESISTSITCEFEVPGVRKGRSYWQERQRYPLLPQPDDELVGFGGEELYLVRPLEETLVGFSYIYIEPDHVRHELVLPLMSLGWLMAEEMETSSTDFLGSEQRARLREILRKEYGTTKFLWSDDRTLPADEVLVRWFTRESIRRGVVTGDRPIPIATGFVGVLSVHPIDQPIDQLSFETTPWRRYVNDQVVSVLSGEETWRYATSTVGTRIDWQGPAIEAAPARTTEVPVLEPTGRKWLLWVGGGIGLLLAAAGAAAGRKKTAVGLGLATLLFVAIGYRFAHHSEAMTERGNEIVGTLLENVYQACGHQDEHEALELLSGACEGALLEELYLELRGQIRGPWATGAGTRVTSVTLEDSELVGVNPQTIAGNCAWTLQARIEHWGHVHERSLRVTGAVRATSDRERWKLREVRLLDKRIVAATSRPRQ
jgi:hypothetical protein